MSLKCYGRGLPLERSAVSSTVTVVFVQNDSAVAAGTDELIAARLSVPCTHSSRGIRAGATPLASSRGEDALERGELEERSNE